MRSLVSLLVLLATVPVSNAGGAEDALSWPTDAGRCVTSSFCEFRPGHFHSGIDISTWGRIGYRCFAVASGDIVRVRISCGGYGRALYLRLPDGRTAVYAHLSRFAGALADTVRARQAAAASGYLDLEFPEGTFPVRQSDVIAWTGQSGAGVPHLHFEIRDPESRPLDPLREGLPVADGLAPVVTRVALTPLTPVSSVDGRSETVMLDVHPTDSPERGVVPRTIPVEGEIGIAIEIDETTDVCRFRLAPHRLELREAGDVLYAVDYGPFTFAESGRMDFQIDPRFSYSKVGRFHALWRRPGNDLPFGTGSSRTGGILRAGQGPREERRLRRASGDETDPSARFPLRGSVQRGEARTRGLRVVAEDAAGNRGVADLRLSFGAPPEIAALSTRLAGEDRPPWEAELGGSGSDTLEVVGAVRFGGRPLADVRLEWSPDAGSTWLPATAATPDPDGSFRARIPLWGRVPGEGPRQVIVRAQARDELGAAGLAHSVAPDGVEPPESGPPRPRIVTLGGWAEMRFDASVPWSAVSGGWETLPGGEQDAAVLVRPDGKGVRVILDARPAPDGPREWTGLGNEWKGIDPWGRPVALSCALPGSPGEGSVGEVRALGDRAVVRFPGETFREPAVVMVREASAPTNGTGELTPVSALWVVDSGSVPFAQDWVITIDAVDAESANPDRVGIFVQESDGFRYIGGERDGERAAWSTSARTVLPVGLFEDAVPPVLGEPRLEERHGHARLTFQADDRGAGLECDGVEVLFDGAPIPHELDDETGDVVAAPPIAAETGEGGVFEIRAIDRCGNPARRVDTVRFP